MSRIFLSNTHYISQVASTLSVILVHIAACCQPFHESKRFILNGGCVWLIGYYQNVLKVVVNGWCLTLQRHLENVEWKLSLEGFSLVEIEARFPRKWNFTRGRFVLLCSRHTCSARIFSTCRGHSGMTEGWKYTPSPADNDRNPC